MSLSFPNPTRSFDEARNAVRFSGHDGLFEVQFMVEAGALARGGEKADMSEAYCLSAFDRLRPSIDHAARAAYSQKRRNFYLLSAADFR